MDARLVFLLMVVVLFGARQLRLALQRRSQAPEQADEYVMLPVAEACAAQPVDAVQQARDKARRLEEEVESAPGPDHMAYSAGAEGYHYAHLRRAHFRCARGDFAGARLDYVAAESWEHNTHHGPGIFYLYVTEEIDVPALLAGLDAFIAAYPHEPPALRERAYRRLCAGDAEGAILDCDAALAWEGEDGFPKDGFARALRGIARRRSGDAAGAGRDLDAAVAVVSPLNPWPRFARAGVALLEGAPGAALADLRGLQRTGILWPLDHCLANQARRRLSGVALAYPVAPEELETLRRIFGPGIATP